jgi:hypothetical protein
MLPGRRAHAAAVPETRLDVIEVFPGFHAEATLRTSNGLYRSRGPQGSRSSTPGIAPAAVLVWTGHCGCPADEVFGLPCICYDIVPDPPDTVPVHV